MSLDLLRLTHKLTKLKKTVLLIDQCQIYSFRLKVSRSVECFILNTAVAGHVGRIGCLNIDDLWNFDGTVVIDMPNCLNSSET